jgi:hypothetical protein
MADKRVKFTPHSDETISKILELHDNGARSKDIYRQSKIIFGFSIKQSTISNILKRYGRDAKINTFRIKRGGAPKNIPDLMKIDPVLPQGNSAQ